MKTNRFILLILAAFISGSAMYAQQPRQIDVERFVTRISRIAA